MGVLTAISLIDIPLQIAKSYQRAYQKDIQAFATIATNAERDPNIDGVGESTSNCMNLQVILNGNPSIVSPWKESNTEEIVRRCC